MALGPKAITEEEEKNPELIDMTRRFKVSCHEFQLCFGGGQCAEAEKGKAMKESG